MAEVTGLRNSALPYPVYGVPFGITFPLLDADGDPISPSSPDSERSLNGDTFADCTNEATEIATSSGICYLLLTAAEMTADVVTVRIQSTGAKTTVMTLYPRKLPTLNSGTVGANAGDGTTLQLASGAVAIDDFYNGCLLVGTIDTVVEARVISDYVGSTLVCTVSPAFNTAPDNNDTYVVYQPEGRVVNQSTVVGWVATAVATPSVNGVPEVDLTHVAGATTNVAALATNVDAILTDTSTTLDDLIDTEIATLISEVGKIPKSDGTSSWNATALAAIQSEANDALVAYDPPTRAEATTDVNSVLTVLGTPAGASISADILVIDNFVDGLETTIGAAGAGLTAVPWNAAWDAEVQSEVDDALVAQRLDELLNADSDIDGAAPPTVGSVVHELMSKTAGSFTYDQTTDSLEAIRDKETDIETDTAEIGAAGAGLTALASAANLSTVAGYLDTEIAAILADTNELQTDWVNGGRLDLILDIIAADTTTDIPALIDALPTAAENADAVWDEAATGHTDAGKAGEQLWTDLDAVLVDTGTTLQAELDGIQADTEDIQSRLPAALVNSRMDATIDGTGMEAAAVAAIADGVWDEATTSHTTSGTFGEQVKTDIDAILADTNELQTDDYPTSIAAVKSDTAAILTDTAEIGAAGAGLTALATQASVNTIDDLLDTELPALTTEVGKIPKSDGTSSWNATALAAIQGEANDALVAYDPPTNAELTTAQGVITALLPAALTGDGNMKVDVLAISGDTTAADRLEALMDGIIVAQVNDAGASTTSFVADGFTEATNDHFNGRLITFLTGALAGQQTAITDYVGATQTLTVTALTEAPANDIYFVIH